MSDIEILGLRLQQTCFACPEQYDVYNRDGKQVAYFRLRHGRFTAESPDCGGELVYMAHPNGDGIFYSEERMFYLTQAVKAVIEHAKY